MESVDRHRLSLAIYPALLDTTLSGPARANAIAAAAEAYPFPTNLDRDVPVDGLAPPSQADVLSRAVGERWSEEALRRELEEHRARRRSV
jgi:hypothetical protein